MPGLSGPGALVVDQRADLRSVRDQMVAAIQPCDQKIGDLTETLESLRVGKAGVTADQARAVAWIFLRRFFANQFKRSCLPDGPKVGSISLSPRGDWRMPSDAEAALWLKWADEER